MVEVKTLQCLELEEGLLRTTSLSFILTTLFYCVIRCSFLLFLLSFMSH